MPIAFILFLDAFPEFYVIIWSGVDLVEHMVVLETGIQLALEFFQSVLGDIHLDHAIHKLLHTDTVVRAVRGHDPRQGRTLGLEGLHLGVILCLLGLLLDILFLFVHDLLSFLLGLIDQTAQLGIGRAGHAHCSHGDGGNQ